MPELYVVRNRDGRFELLLQRRSRKVGVFPDTWTVPGGGFSKAERVIAFSKQLPESIKWKARRCGALREFVEEAGGGFLFNESCTENASDVVFPEISAPGHDTVPATTFENITIPPSVRDCVTDEKLMHVLNATQFLVYLSPAIDAEWCTQWHPRALPVHRWEIKEDYVLATDTAACVYGYVWADLERVLKNPEVPVEGSTAPLAGIVSSSSWYTQNSLQLLQTVHHLHQRGVPTVPRSVCRRIFLMRHGQSVANAVGNCSQHVKSNPAFRDAPLTVLGRQQASTWRSLVHQWNIDGVLVSPLTRTLQTAHEAFGHISHPLHLHPCLRERWWEDVANQGTLWPVMESHLAPLGALGATSIHHVTDHLHDTEHWDPLQEALLPVEELTRRSDEALVAAKKLMMSPALPGCIAVVTHFGVIQHLTGQRLRNCDVICIDIDYSGDIISHNIVHNPSLFNLRE